MLLREGVRQRRGQRSEPPDTPTVSIGDKVKGGEEETAKQLVEMWKQP